MWTDGRYIFRKSIPEMVQAASPPQKKNWECAGKLDGRLAGNGFWELTRDSSREHAAEPFPGTLQTVCPESCPATHSGNHANSLQGVPSKNHI